MTTLKTAPLKASETCEEICMTLVPKAFESFAVSMDFFSPVKKKTHTHTPKKKTKHLWLLNGTCPCWRKPHLYIIQRSLASSCDAPKIIARCISQPESHMRSSSTLLLSRSVQGCQHTNKITGFSDKKISNHHLILK